MKKRSFLSLILIIVIVFAMAACGKADKPSPTPDAGAAVPTANPEQSTAPSQTPEAPNGNVKIGLLVYNDKNEYIQKLISGVKEKCDEYGYEVTTYSADKDTAKEINNMEDVISLKPNLILYNPVDSDAAKTTVGLANAAGIPIITIDRVANGGDVVSHIASDNVYGGKLAGDYMVELLGAEGGEVVELQGQAGTSAARERGEGFHSVVDTHPEIKVVVSQIGNWDKAEGMAIMENALQTYPNIKAVFAHNDTMALGAMEAALAAGKKDIKIIGFDADDDAVKAVQEGKMAATIEQLPILMGNRGAELAYKYINGETVPEAEAVEVNLIKTQG